MDVVTLGMAKADARKNQAPAPSPVPPANPAPNQLWLSSALKDLRFPTDPKDRLPVVTKTNAWEANAIQEPCSWIANGKFNLLATAGNGGILYTSCPLTSDPTKPANWTKHPTAVIPAAVNHGSVYVEGSTIYYFGNVEADKTIKVYTSSLSDPLTWSAGTTVMTLPAIASTFGNTYVVKDGSTYIMLIEYKATSNSRWQIGQASSNTVTGTYTLIPGAEVMTSLWADSDHQTAGNPTAYKENGEWVMFYHSSIVWNGFVPSDVYRATAPSLGSDNWTITDNKLPILTRVTQYEVDQVADIDIVRTASGAAYGFWTGMHNRNGGTGFVGAQHCAALMPTLKRWDGNTWVKAQGNNDSSGGIHVMQKPFTVQLAADFTGTSTTFANVTNMSCTRRNTGPDMEVRLSGVFTHTGTAGDKISFQVTRAGANPKSLGSLISDGSGRPMSINSLAKYTLLNIGSFNGYTLQYKVSAGTLNIRPVAQADTEQINITVADSAYP